MAKKFEFNQRRVVGFIGHAGGGKTSLCEALLFNAKANERIGSVDQGTSVMDNEPEEQKRRYSVSAHFFDIAHKTAQIFLLDTPGNSNFVPESVSLINAMGAAFVAVDGADGVKYQTEILLQRAKEEKLPIAAVVTKLDKEHSDFDKALASIRATFPVEPVVIHLPVGAEAGFNGVVDLLANKAYLYADGKASETDIPASVKDQAEELRTTMIERLVEGDDDVMTRYLDGGEIAPEELAACLKRGVAEGLFCPVLIASPVKNIGIDLLANFAVAAFPHPGEERLRVVTNPKTGENSTLRIAEEGPFVAQVIKTLSDPFTGKISIMRVFRGKLTGEETFFNINRGGKEKPGKFFYLRGKKQEQIDFASAGEVVSVVKLKEIATGDTLLASEADALQLPSLPTMEPMVHMAVYPKTKGEEEKMSGAVQRIMEEDINLRFWREDETKEFIVSGVGQSQLDVAMERMKRKFGAEVELRRPKIPYRETIKGKAEAQGKHKKQSGGRGQYGDCHIRVEPKPRGEGFEFVDAIVGGVIPGSFIPAVEKGIVEAMKHGELAGCPVQDVRVELFYGSYHDVDSSEMAFKIAGSLAWKKCYMDATPILLEPIMKVDISVPSEYMGDVYGNLSSRRGRVLGSDDSGKMTVIHSTIPQAETMTLSADLRAMTGDKATFVAHFSHYEEVPATVAEKVIAEAAKEKEAKAAE